MQIIDGNIYKMIIDTIIGGWKYPSKINFSAVVLFHLDLKELLQRVANIEQEVKSWREFRTNS